MWWRIDDWYLLYPPFLDCLLHTERLTGVTVFNTRLWASGNWDFCSGKKVLRLPRLLFLFPPLPFPALSG